MSQRTFKDLRQAKGLSSDFVAKVLGVESYQLIEFETDGGSMPCSIAVKLCKLYGVVSFDDIDF